MRLGVTGLKQRMRGEAGVPDRRHAGLAVGLVIMHDQKLLDRYGPKGFVVIGLKFDTMQDTEDPIRFARKIGVHYPLALASDELKAKFGGIEGLPTTMLYDRSGVLRKKIIGFEYTSTVEEELKPLLSGITWGSDIRKR